MGNMRTQQSYKADAKIAEQTGQVHHGVHYLSEWDRLPYFESTTCALIGIKLYAFFMHILCICDA